MSESDAPTGGIVIVRTDTAHYLLDLDAAAVTRYPAPSGTPLRRDGQVARLLVVLTCELGKPLELLLLVAAQPGVVTYRQTTSVRAITRLWGSAPESATDG